MPRRKNTSPRTGKSLLDGIFGRVRLAREAQEWSALYAWYRLAGERLSRHTRAEKVLGRTLLVRVATSAWANELTYLRADLLARLRLDPGAAVVNELRFTVGPLEGLPEWSDPEPAPPPPPVSPPAVDAGRVAEALLAVADPELRAGLAELFARSQARG
jgi:hypothetical protein